MATITNLRRIKDDQLARWRPVRMGIFGVGTDWLGIFAIGRHQNQIVNKTTITAGNQLTLRPKIRLPAIGHNRPAFPPLNAVKD